jgi:hypothetical protein
MGAEQKPIGIVAVDRVQGGLILVFSDEKTIFFPAELLYQHKADNGTRDFTDAPDPLA